MHSTFHLAAAVLLKIAGIIDDDFLKVIAMFFALEESGCLVYGEGKKDFPYYFSISQRTLKADLQGAAFTGNAVCIPNGTQLVFNLGKKAE
ncbi:MAG: hypothetical protein HQK54_09905 [Oligoflexales bacterium]|nr:hypothetical protein [Oligoflexales bacterium]